MEQTAVEWLLCELVKFHNGESEYFSDVAIKNHAKRMEKEQIIEAFGSARKYIHTTVFEYEDAEQYYNENYGVGK